MPGYCLVASSPRREKILTFPRWMKESARTPSSLGSKNQSADEKGPSESEAFIGSIYDAAIRVCKAVLVLYEQPFVRRAPGTYQRPGALQFVSAKEHRDLPYSDALPHPGFGLVAVVERQLASLIRRIGARIPDDHLARAVLAFRDHSLERCVIERMVLHHHSQPLVTRVQRGPFRHRPRLQHAIDFEAVVIVQASSGVLLNHKDERPAAFFLGAGSRLWRAFEVALFPVFLEHTPIMASKAHFPLHTACAGSRSDSGMQD